MSEQDNLYLENREMIQNLTNECVRYENENDVKNAKVTFIDLASIYHRIKLYDFEAKTFLHLAHFLKRNELFSDFESYLNKAFDLYNLAIFESEDKKLLQDNNSFYLELAEAYLSIGSYNRATECALISLKAYSIGLNLEKAIKILYSIEDKKDADLDNYLYQRYGQSRVKELKSLVNMKVNKSFYDPIEDTGLYRKAFLESENEIKEKTLKLGEKIGSEKYFEIKKEVLKEKYGIIWESTNDLQNQNK